MCVRAFVRMRGYAAVFTQGEGERSLARATRSSRLNAPPPRTRHSLIADPTVPAPRPDPRDFQDTRHTTHKPRTLCEVNQLDPSSLRARYRYNGAAGARRNETSLQR